MVDIRDLGRASLAAVGLLLAAAAPAWAGKPNIIFVLTDDQTPSLVTRMPNLKRLVADRGATFTHAYYNEPLCAPSRATMLTGKYRQNTGVETNSYPPFVPHEGETVALALHDAGYRTGLFGKYLNRYPGPLGAGHVPPGWDRWFAMLTDFGDGDAKGYFDYRVDDQGVVRRYGTSPAEYSTDVLGAEALAFVRRALADGVPFFADLALHAPHTPSTPAPRDAGALAGAAAPRDPAFDEADVSDKPAYVRGRKPLDAATRANIDHSYRDMARSLLSVDRTIAAFVDVLTAAGALGTTYIVFASDNGWMMGDHRLAAGKGVPYEEANRVPLYVRGPGVAPGSRIGRIVGNADLGRAGARAAAPAPRSAAPGGIGRS
jgi:N-acetylglucosamine-6-sulfatase